MEWWHKVEGWGKAHPVLLGFVVFIVGAILLWALWPSPSGATGPQQQAGPAQPDLAALAASGNALQAAQLQAQAATHASDNQLTAAKEAIAGQVTIADIASNTSLGIAGLQADTAGKEIAAGRDVALQSSTLTAQTAQAGYNRDVNIATLQYGAATDQARIAADAFTTGKAIDASVANSSFQAQLGLAGIDLQKVQAGANAYLTGKIIDISGRPEFATHTNILATGVGGQQLNVNVGPPAIENLGYTEIFKLADAPGGQGYAARQYLGIPQ